MADGPNLPDIKRLLDSPGVSDDVKRELIWAYGSRRWDSAPDLQSYADRLEMPRIGIAVPFGMPLGDLDKAVDDAHKQLTRHESENGKQVLGEGATGAAGSNSILDLGAPGLRYFEYFAPLYQMCVVGTDIVRDKACQLYDEQRDMNFAALRADGAALTTGAAKLSEEISRQRNAWNTVDQAWTGQGAEAANSAVDGYLGQAGTAQAQVEKFATVLYPAADALETAVHDKAQFVAGLYADTIGGKTPGQIDEIIYYTQHGHDILTSLPEAARIVHMFGASAAPDGGDILKIVVNPVFGGSSAALDLLDKAKQFATNFVDNVFKPDVEAKWRGLVDTCAATDRSIREIYQRVVADANTINDHPFTASTGTVPPITASKQNPDTDHQSGHPGTGVGGDHTQVGGSPAPVHPQHTPSTPPPPAALAGPAISGGAGSPVSAPAVAPHALLPPIPSGSIGAPVPATMGSLPQGWTVNPATAELTPPARGTTVRSVDLAGTGPAITITDGQRTLTAAAEEGGAHGLDFTVSDPTGRQSRYTVEMGPDGLPHLAAEPPVGTTPIDAAVPIGEPAGAFAGPGSDPALTPAGLPENPVNPGGPADVDAVADAAGSPSAAAAGQPDGEPADDSVQVRAARRRVGEIREALTPRSMGLRWPTPTRRRAPSPILPRPASGQAA